MTNRLHLFIAGLTVFVLARSLSDAEKHQTTRAQLEHATARIETLNTRVSVNDTLLADLRTVLREHHITLAKDDSELGERIDAVADDISGIQSRLATGQRTIREHGEHVDDVLARLSDVEVAVGMPGSDVIIEPEVDLIQPNHTLRNCQSEFRSINWAAHEQWALDGIRRGWTCSRMGASLVRTGHVVGADAVAVCAVLYPRLPWADHKRRVQRWGRDGMECHALAERLKEKTQ